MIIKYNKPEIQIKLIESEIMDNVMSIPIYSDDNIIIEDGLEVLSNKSSVWDE